MWTLACAVAAGGDDLRAEAESLMELPFDLDDVSDSLSLPAAAPAAARAAPASREGFLPTPTAPSRPPLPLEPNSTLTTVTVHRDRAFVTRERRETLPIGSHALPFEGLPHAVLAEGLSAKVVDGQAHIVAVELRSGIGDVADSERIERVRAEAEREVERLGVIRDRIESLLAQRAYLRSALVPPGATSAPPVKRVRTGLAYVGMAEVRIAEDLRQEQAAAEELGKVVEPLLRKLAEPLATGREVWVEVEVDRPGPVAVALRYAVAGTGWTPAYNARLDPETGEVELEVFGVVTQSTREDWTDAALFLATGDAYDRATLPTLSAWTLGRSGTPGLFVGAGVTTAAAPSTAPQRAQVVTTELDARVEDAGVPVLAIQGPRTIRGDGSPQRLPVARQRLAADVRLATIPKVAPSVQRRAVVRYDGSVPLLPGPVSAFVRSDYVGAGQIRSVVPGEGLELEFGTDDRFRVSRELVERVQTRIGKATSRYDFRFRTTLVNHGAVDAVVSVLDQVPLTDDPRIVVQTLDTSGAPGPAADGLVSWQVPVPAGGRAHVDLAFTVTVPDPLHHHALLLGLLY